MDDVSFAASEALENGQDFQEVLIQHLTETGRVQEKGESSHSNGKEKEDDDDPLLKQLKKMKADISIWHLIIASHKHRMALLNALGKIDVTPEVTPEEMITAVTTGKGTITFDDEDLPFFGSNHNNPLYLTVLCMQKYVPLALVDNGSAVNVCPWKTAKQLGIREEHLSPPTTHLRAYDNSKRKVLGTIELMVNIGPLEKKVEFQVLDIPATFNLLLGRPWLHENRAVPSTLHQKVKLPINDEIVTIEAEQLRASITHKGPVLEITHDRNDEEFYGFEVVAALEEDKSPFDFDPYSSDIIHRILKRQGYLPGLPLGKQAKG